MRELGKNKGTSIKIIISKEKTARKIEIKNTNIKKYTKN